MILILFTLSSCSITEIERNPLLATPLGLIAKTAVASGGGTGVVLYFNANNPEIYFTGFSIYVSTEVGDLTNINPDNVFFPINPMDVAGTSAQLLTNYSPVTDTNLTIYIGACMSYPSYYTYPEDASFVAGSVDDNDPDFSLTTFSTLPDGTAFADGTTYYFAVYSYSSLDVEYSLPSNIARLDFEDL